LSQSQASARQRLIDSAICAALLVAAISFWKLRILDPAAPGAFEPSPGQGDNFTYTYPMFATARRALAEGELPLWNPLQASGHPHLAAAGGGTLYPLHLPSLLLPPHWAIEASVVLHLALAAVFTYAYARTLGLLALASVAAALAYAFSGFVVSQAVWFVPALSACVWLPLALLAIEKIFAHRRDSLWAAAGWAWLLAAAVALPILAGWLQTWMYSLYAIAIYAAVHLAEVLRRGTTRAEIGVIVTILCGGLLLGLGLASVQLIPSLELRGLTPYRAGGLTAAEILSQSGTLPPGRFLAESLDPTPRLLKWSYLGVVPWLLIPMALLVPARRVQRLALVCVVALALGVSLSLGTAAFDLLLHVPTASWFRVPQRILFLYAFAGSMLTGIAIHTLASTSRTAKTDRRLRWGAGAMAVLALIAALHLDIPGRGPGMLAASVVLLGCAVAFRGAIPRRLACIALVALLACDAFLATRNTLKRPAQAVQTFQTGETAFDFLRRVQGDHRTYLHAKPFDFALMPKRTTLERIRGVQDYEPLSLARRVSFFERLGTREADPAAPFAAAGWPELDPTTDGFALLDLMSVRYILARSKNRTFGNALAARSDPWRVALRTDPRGFTIYENPAPLPRAYLVFHAIAAEDPQGALQKVADPDFDPRRSAVLEGLEAASDTAASGLPAIVPARVAWDRSGKLEVHVDAPRPGHLVVTDTPYPGWQALVDGEAAEILPANVVGRAVRVGAGPHTVVFRYAPRSFAVGAGLTLAVLALATAHAVALLVRRRS
jgi:hypothetical protein